MIKKYKEIIIAGAIGDAFGYFVEFDRWNTIIQKYGENGIQFHLLPNNDWHISDDTQMTFFCLQSIIKYINNDKHDLNEINKEIYHSYLDWLKTQLSKYNSLNNYSDLLSFEELYYKEAPGATCITALNSKRMGSIDKIINDSKGCGGIMRVAPCAFLNISIADVFKLGCFQASITHSHPNGYLSAGFFAGLLKALLENNSFEKSIELNINILKTYKKHEDILIYIHKVLSLIKNEDIIEHDILNNFIGEGWVGEEALGIAMYAMKKGKNFSHVLDIATNHNGDSDSTASLAAQLYISQNPLPIEFSNFINNFKTKKVFNYLFKELDRFIILP